MNESSPPSLPVLNLAAQYASLRVPILRAIERVLEDQRFILGPEVEQLEQEIAAFCDVPYAVGVASGTDALLLALKACGVGPGDEVIVPAFTFVATADVVCLLGATPVFADIEPDTFNLDVTLLQPLVTPATKAIIPVHLYGQPANMDEILTFAASTGLRVIGDTAQALGARYKDAPVCSLGDIGCISFFPSKNLGAYGDGGMVVTRDAALAKKMKMLRAHGSRTKYCSEFLGWNSRLDELQAAILRVKLPHLDTWNAARAHNARLYDELLGGVEAITLPHRAADRTHVFHQYTVRVPNRDAVQSALQREGIQTAVHYPIPLHLQPMFANMGYTHGSLPEAEQATREVLSLPMYPELARTDIERVCSQLRAAVEARTAVAP